MTRRILAVAISFLALTTLGAGQGVDPVSGSWASDGATFFELQFDGKRAVTGSVWWRGGGEAIRAPIRTGTYDVDTRKLTLEGEGTRSDGRSGSYVIAGTIDGDTVSGTYKFGDRSGDFTFTRVPSGQRTPEQIEALFGQHKGDFDYLLGDWQFGADSKEHGKYGGYWSAVKLADGQILDEFRVTGDKDETYYVTTSLRNYNKFADRWELIGADAGTGMQDFGTARRVGSEMHIEQQFGVASGQPAIMKIRYYNIEKDKFSWAADRSTDGGKTWVKNHLQIEARRIGPPRTMEPLAPARKKKANAQAPGTAGHEHLTEVACVDVPPGEKRPEFGCFNVGAATGLHFSEASVYWHLRVFPSRKAAEAAKSAAGIVVEEDGRVWLSEFGARNSAPREGKAIAVIGPLQLPEASSYTAVLSYAVMRPGDNSRVHTHPGPEGWYVLAGEQCLETPAGADKARAGGTMAVPSNIPMELVVTGKTLRRAFALVIHDATQQRGIPSDWKPSGACSQ